MGRIDSSEWFNLLSRCKSSDSERHFFFSLLWFLPWKRNIFFFRYLIIFIYESKRQLYAWSFLFYYIFSLEAQENCKRSLYIVKDIEQIVFNRLWQKWKNSWMQRCTIHVSNNIFITLFRNTTVSNVIRYTKSAFFLQDSFLENITENTNSTFETKRS